MLSRVADSLYWINRYVERAENISRFLEVSEAMARSLDAPMERIRVMITEMPKQHFGIAGQSAKKLGR